MKQIIVGLTFIFYILSIATSSIYADIVVITDKNKVPKFVLDTSTGKTSPVNGVYVEGGTTSDPTTPPEDPQPPTNPTESEATKAAKEAAIRVGIKQDAATLAAVYQFFAEQLSAGTMDVAGFKKSFDLARGMAGANLKGKWTDELKILDKYVKDVEIWSLIKNLSDMADGFASYAGTTPQNLMNAESGNPQNLDIGSILALLQIILEFLKAIGVIK